MTKIVYNACFGGFGLSEAAVLRYAELKGIKLYPERDGRYKSLALVTWWTVPEEQWRKHREFHEAHRHDWYALPTEQVRAYNEFYKKNFLYDKDISRADPALVQVVEELGTAASGHHAQLQIRELPEGTLYRIDEYDGNESVMTQDDYEWSIA